jgi:hypothetical protein
MLFEIVWSPNLFFDKFFFVKLVKLKFLSFQTPGPLRFSACWAVAVQSANI